MGQESPSENASFMPWLVGAALIHAQAITEKRGALRAWTLLLSIFAFSLSLLGTFLVRSGVLTSVHAFTSDPRRGIFILIMLGVAVGASLLLYALRAPKVTAGKRFSMLSRETLIVIGNLMFVISTAMILIGTLYPLIGDLFGLGRVSVGPPYFGPLFILLMAPTARLYVGSPSRHIYSYNAGCRSRCLPAPVCSASAQGYRWQAVFDAVP